MVLKRPKSGDALLTLLEGCDWNTVKLGKATRTPQSTIDSWISHFGLREFVNEKRAEKHAAAKQARVDALMDALDFTTGGSEDV